MQRLPGVPVPPTNLSAPHTGSVVFLVLCSVAMVVAIGFAAWRARSGDWLFAVFLVGGLASGMLEPMLDYLGLLWFAADNAAIAVETFHRRVPLYVVMGYSFYFGALSYVAYRGMLAGRGARWFLAFYAIDWLADFALQATGQSLGLYQYYGHQPLMLFDVPMWWFTIDAALPVLCGGTLFLLRDQLPGWRCLVVIPLVPACYAALNAGAGWPVFSALNSGPATWVIWLAGIATMALALLYRQLMLSAIFRRQAADGLVGTASAAPRGLARSPDAATA